MINGLVVVNKLVSADMKDRICNWHPKAVCVNRHSL